MAGPGANGLEMLARIALDRDSCLCDSILGQLLPLQWGDGSLVRAISTGDGKMRGLKMAKVPFSSEIPGAHSGQ